MNALARLTTYSSSDSDEDDNSVSDQTKREKLPLPTVFVRDSQVKTVIREQNEDGKIRNFPHERGIWATYVYAPLDPFPELLMYLEKLQKFFSPLKLHLTDDFHISLTKTVILKHHWIEDFCDIVRTSLQDIVSFKLHLSQVKVYVNESKTRTFLSVIVDEGVENLKCIVERLDGCLQQYNLEPFYKDPSFHLSLLWCSGDRYNELMKLVQDLPPKLRQCSFFMNVSHCICTSGNKNFTFRFQ